jgi:flagellar motility protein MotE (MotC chaperone)
MKAVLSAMITCAVIFGLSAGATQYFLKQQPAEVESGEETASPEADAQADVPPAAADSMPVSFRPDANVSVEAVLQMSDSIKRMEQELAEREEKVKRDEMRIKLMFDDLATEQDELRAFSEGIDAKVELLGRMKSELEQTLVTLEQKKSELDKLVEKTEKKPETGTSDVEEKVDDVKSWFANLEPEQAAEYLREFSNNGKMTFAASLLQKMPDRQKSKILGAMNDPVLVDQLIEALTGK